MSTLQVGGQKRIAVIGGGVAGIVCAHRLQERCAVTLFEGEEYLGGHTHTIPVPDGPDAGLAVDTGFIVFNEKTYPHFIAFLRDLGVADRTTEMSFGYHCRSTGFSYAGNTLNGLFSQRRNLVRPSFYRFLLEIARFCRQAEQDLERNLDLGSLEEYVRDRRFQPFMVEHYLLPMAAAIWSTPTARVGGFPALPFLRFFKNHGLLDLVNRPRWHTVQGGSWSYVQAFSRTFSGTIRLQAKVRRVVREDGGVTVELADGAAMRFDEAVIATHADQALSMLVDPDPDEKRLLGAWQYERNEVVLHTDITALPPNRRTWSCWNFMREPQDDGSRPVYVTYSMNLLQGLETERQYMVSLNRPGDYAEAQVIRRMVYHHPRYTGRSMATQDALPTLNRGPVSFCGSYFGYGFHEDAVRAAVAAAATVEGRQPA